jgi:hypothetical protein
MSHAQGLAVAAFLALAPPARAAKVTLVLEDAKSVRAASALAGPGVSVVAFDRPLLGDPILKGRFLASLQAADLVVSAARGKACGWIAHEAEVASLRCVPTFSSSQLVEFARAAGWRRIAGVYVPAYLPVFEHVRAAARARGIELRAVPVERARDLPRALPAAFEDADAAWLMGDGVLDEDASMEYIVELSLARRVPLIATDPAQLAHGAYLSVEYAPGVLLRHAVSAADAAALGAPPDAALEPPAGKLVVNEVLSRRWGLRPPGGAR